MSFTKQGIFRWIPLAKKMRQQRCHQVKVCTVHGAQGGEWHTVIFDPVDGESGFFKGANARRLVNVAVSRSKGRFLIALTQADGRNPLFHRLSAAIQQQNLRSVLPPSKPPVAAGPVIAPAPVQVTESSSAKHNQVS